MTSNLSESQAKNKYIKYKNKFLNLREQINYNIKNHIGGANTYIDFITKYSNNTIKIDLNNESDIFKILNKHFKNINKLICLDFHGVTDLYNDNEIIPSNLPKCVISYIGGNPETIRNTINTIKP